MRDTLHYIINTFTHKHLRVVIIVFIKGVGARIYGKTGGVFFVALQLFLPANYSNFNFKFDFFLDEEEE